MRGLLARLAMALALVVACGVGVVITRDAAPSQGAARSPGGWISALAVDPATPSTVFAVGGNGVHVSTDRGSSWRRVRIEGDVGASIGTLMRAVVVGPDDQPTLYVGGDAVYASDDGGATWRKSTPGGIRVQALALDPARHGVVYAGGGETRWRVFRSADAGRTWESVRAGLYTGTVAGLWALAVTPSRPTVVYAGGGLLPWRRYGRVYKSVDGARTWRRLVAFPTTGAVMSIAVDPRRPSLVLAGTNRDLLRSADGGKTWRSTGLDRIAVPSGDFAGGLIYVGSLAFDPVRRGTVYAGTRFGVFASQDGGRAWWRATIPGTNFAKYAPEKAFVGALALDPDADRLYVGTQAGTVVSARLPLAR